MTGRVVFVRGARGVQYAGLFICSILCHVLLLALTIAPISLPVLALICLWVLWPTAPLGDYGAIVRVLSLLSSAGLLSWSITKFGKSAWKQFIEICKVAKSVIVKGWASDWKSLEGLETAWRDYIIKKAPKKVWTALKEAKLLTISLTGYVLLVALNATFASAQQGPAGPRGPAGERGPAGKQGAAGEQGTAGPPGAPAETVAPGQPEAPEQPETSHEIKLFLKPGAVFHLAYAENARPRDSEGICLGKPQQKWLDEFRKAIGNCIEAKTPATDDSKPVFKVTGYASIAPMHVGGDTSVSPRLNCKVANWRAAAVGAYLANPDKHAPTATRWDCEKVKNAFNQNAPTNENECGERYDGPKNQEDSHFFVEVHQWCKPSDMIENKPANDGEMPSPRRYDVEIMNRVVRIEVPEHFCGDAAQESSAS